MLFTDSEQPGKYFLLAGFSIYPDQDKQEVELIEYDNSTTITLS